METVQRQMSTFKDNLEDFARKHREQINSVPEFRARFNQMCKTMGADPLASNKSFWAKILGIGEFYTDLGIQIVDICYTSRATDGGLLEMSELLRRLRNMRGKNAHAVSQDDVVRAIDKLELLEGGFKVVEFAGRTLVQSIPADLTDDQTSVMKACGTKAYTTLDELAAETGWPESRCMAALDSLMNGGMVWVDDGGKQREYWMMALTAMGEA
nr:vacuolar protein sorting 22 [Carpediemonas membranifera]